jgi:type VI secretion system secreted protein VgrG
VKEKEWKMKAEAKHNPKDMGLSRSGIIFLKDKENKALDKNGRHIIYDDKTQKPVSPGQPLPDGATIGYGHLIKKGEDFSKGLSEKEAVELFKEDIRDAENIVRNNISAPLNQHQFDGLVSLAYNIGVGNFRISAIRQYVNNPDTKNNKYPTPESAWKAWNKDINQKTGNLEVVKGLVNRRNDDWNIYENGIY